MNLEYAAVIIDVINSRKVEDKKRLVMQEKINDCINCLNILFADQINKKVICSAGDEFQGLFRNPYSAFIYVSILKLLISPMKIRCGIGIGTIKFLNNDLNSLNTDGEAYYYARDSINYVSKNYNEDLILVKGKRFSHKRINSLLYILNKIITKFNYFAELIYFSLINYYYREYFNNELLLYKIYKKMLDLNIVFNEQKRKYNNYIRKKDLTLKTNVDLKAYLKYCDVRISENEWIYSLPFGIQTNISKLLGTNVQLVSRYIKQKQINEAIMLFNLVFKELKYNV